MTNTQPDETDLPDHLNPFAIMRDNGFGEYTDAARDVLPADWATRYPHTPRGIAIGVTYYVAFGEYTQVEVANAYGVADISVRNPYASLKADLGKPDHPGDATDGGGA